MSLFRVSEFTTSGKQDSHFFHPFFLHARKSHSAFPSLPPPGGIPSVRYENIVETGDDLRVDLDLDFKAACFGGEEKVGYGIQHSRSLDVVIWDLYVALCDGLGWIELGGNTCGTPPLVLRS